VLTVIVTKRGDLFEVVPVIVTKMTITGRSISSVNSYCDNNGGGICAVLTVNVTLTGRSLCSVNSYFDINGEVYMQF
jgi:hypothetical protein